jgi:hypothetical protein
MEPDTPTDTQKSLPPPPPLPPRLLALPPIIYAGTAAWFVVSCALLVLRYGFDLLPPIWLWTTLAGTALGLVGLPIMWWQRAASRRGTRGAHRDL